MLCIASVEEVIDEHYQNQINELDSDEKVLKEKIKKFEKIIFILLALIFISATIISFYHFGIEQDFFQESLVCNSNNEINNLNKENLLKELQKITTSCKNVDFRLFGLSLATINTIISFILSVITFKIFFNYEKNK